jgi:phosphopentomutase
MPPFNRVILMIVDGFGVGALPDAAIRRNFTVLQVQQLIDHVFSGECVEQFHDSFGQIKV